MKVDTSVKWYSGKKLKLLNYPDKITYETARMTLDVSYTKIPLATTVGAGKLRQSSTSAGVRGSKGNYYISSFTNYAIYVLNMGDNTNWSTPGTNGKWYERVWKSQGKQLLNNAIERNKLQ